MELWIQTQDRGELVKINNRIFVRKDKKAGEFANTIYCDTGSDYIPLGTYKEPYEAYEVLDDLLRTLRFNLASKTFNGFVFDMPEDKPPVEE